jgi:hypothetical protein
MTIRLLLGTSSLHHCHHSIIDYQKKKMVLRIQGGRLLHPQLFLIVWMAHVCASVATTTNRNRLPPVSHRLQNIFASDDVPSNHMDSSSSRGGIVVFLILAVLFFLSVAVWTLQYVYRQQQEQMELDGRSRKNANNKKNIDLKDKLSCSDETMSNSSGLDESFDVELNASKERLSNYDYSMTLSTQSATGAPINMHPVKDTSRTDHELQLSHRLSYLLDSLESIGGIDCDDETYMDDYDDKAMPSERILMNERVEDKDEKEHEVSTDSCDATSEVAHRSITDSPIAEVLIFNDDEDNMDLSMMTVPPIPYGDDTVHISSMDENPDSDHKNDALYDTADKLLSLLSFSKSHPREIDGNLVLQSSWVRTKATSSDLENSFHKNQRRYRKRPRRSASMERFPDDDSNCSSMEEQAWMEFQQPDESIKSMQDVMVEWNSNPCHHWPQLPPVSLSLINPSRPPLPLSWLTKKVSPHMTTTVVPLAWLTKKVPPHMTTKVEL